MATGVGVGFDLEGLDKALKSADKGLRDLANQAEIQAKRISDAFSLGATKGIAQLKQELSDVKNGISELSKQDIKIKLSSNNFGREIMDEVNRVINYTRTEFERLNKEKVTRFLIPDMSSQFNMGMSQSVNLDSIESIMNRLGALQDALNSGTLGQIRVDDGLRVQINDEIKALNERLSVLRMSTEEFNKMKVGQANAIMQNAQMQVDATDAEIKRVNDEKEAKLAALDAEAKAEQDYQQRTANVREAANDKMKQELREYENELKKVKELEAIQEKTLTLASTTNDKGKISEAQKLYDDIENEIKLHQERIKAIEAKYAVETELIRHDISIKERAKTIDEEVRMEAEKEQRIRQENAKAKQSAIASKDSYNETLRMYERMFEEIAQKEKKAKKEASDYEFRLYEESLSKYRRNKEQQASVDRHYHAQRQKEYEEMFRNIERTQQRERALQNARGDSSKGALNYVNRMYSDKGVLSINNMNTALQKLRDAQSKLNLSTEEGRKKHAELGNAIARVEKDLKKYSNAADEVNKKHRGLMDTSGQLARALAGVFSVSAIKGYVNNLVNIRKEFELQQKSLQLLLKSKDEANKLWQQTIDLAVRSPFRVKELVTYTKQLAAYRIEEELLHDTTKRLADVSAGLGVDMNRLILAFGQVKAANFLRGTELRQFTEAGIPMLGELAKYFTELEGRAISVGDVFERISKRMVSFADVENVFHRMTDAGGTFYQMQEEQSKTLSGMISNLHDSIDLMLNDIGKANDGLLKGSMQTAGNIIDNWREIAFLLEKIVISIGAWKIANSAYILGMKKSAAATLWGNNALKAKIGTSLADIRTLTMQEAKLLGVTKAQYAWGKATLFAQGALRGVGLALKTILPIAIIAGIAELWRVMTKASREAARLKKELDGIITEDVSTLEKNSDAYKDLYTRLGLLNKGTQARREIIGKLNSEYGEYLSFVVDEETSVEQLAEAYDDVVKKMQEKQSLATFEKGMAAIAESYGNSLNDAKDGFYDLFKGASIKSNKNNFSFIVPTKKEIDDIYSIIQQRSREMKAEQLDDLNEQSNLIQRIVKDYYGEEFSLSRDFNSSIDLLDILVDKKEKEKELQEEINLQYKTVLKSREANLALEKLQTEYAEKRRDIENSGKSQFEIQKGLAELATQEKLDVIDIKVRFGEMDEAAAKIAKDKILNWATELNKSINDAILRDVGKIDTDRLDALKSEIKQVGEEMEQAFNGNVDLLNRKIIPASELAKKGWENVGEGIATVFSSQYGIEDKKGKVHEILVTPILPDGTVLSQEELEKYIDDELQGAKDILQADTKGIVIAVDVDEKSGERLHNLQEKYYNFIQQVQNMYSHFSEEDLSKVLITESMQKSQSSADYVKQIQSSWETQNRIIKEQISLKSAGLDTDESILENAEKLERLYRGVADILGIELKYTERLSEESRNAINAMLPEEYQITLEQAYNGIDSILSNLKTKEKEHLNVIEQLNEQKKNGLPIDEEALRLAEENYWWVKKTQDLLDPSAKTAISKSRVSDINSKLEEKYQIDSIDRTKDEATLLSEANTEKQKAIAYEAQLLAMKARGVTVADEELSLAKKEVEQWTLRWELLGGTDKEKKGSSHTNSLYDERIKVIDDMNKKYNELKRTLTETEAKQGAFDAYIDAFATAYKDVNWVPKDVKEMSAEDFATKVLGFTDKDKLVEFLDKLAKEPMKTFEKIKVELAKGKYVEEMTVESRKTDQEKMLRQVEDMFGNYEVSLEMDKLNIPPDLAKRLFGVDAIDVSELRQGVLDKLNVQDQLQLSDEDYSELSKKSDEDILDFAKKGGMATDMIDELEKYLNQAAEMEDKALEERMKKYVEYARYGLNERAKIKVEELKKIKEIDEAFQIKEGDSDETISAKNTMREMASDKAKKESDDAMRKLEWEEFEKSDMFVNLFNDLNGASETLLSHTITKLQEFREQWKDMPLEEVNMITDKIAELEQAMANLKPFDAGKKAKQDYQTMLSSFTFENEEAKELQASGKRQDVNTAIQMEQVYQETKLAKLDDEISKYETVLRIKGGMATSDEMLLANEEEYSELLKQDAGSIQEQLDQSRQQKTNTEKQLTDVKELTDQQKKLVASYKAQAKAYDDVLGQVTKVRGAFNDIITALGEEDSAFAVFGNMAFDMAETVLQTLSLQANLNAAQVAATGLGAAMNTAMGIIGWIVMAIQLLVKAFTAIVSFNKETKKLNIQTYQHQVEKLTKSYEALAEATKEAWDVNVIRANTLAMKQANDEAKKYQENVIAMLEDNNKVKRALRAEEKLANGEKLTRKEKKALQSDEYQEYLDAVEEYEDLEMQMENDMNDLLSKFGDFDISSVAEQFADAWISAFQETGEGLSGLEEEWDNYFDDIVKKQAVYNGLGAAFEEVLNYTKNALKGDFEIDEKELKEIQRLKEEALENADKTMTSVQEAYGAWDANSDNSKLSGLQAGIQGITEQQADVLAGYWNAVRFDVSAIRQRFEEYIAMQGGNEEANPMLTVLQQQLETVKAIRNMFESVIGSGNSDSHTGSYLKVMI